MFVVSKLSDFQHGNDASSTSLPTVKELRRSRRQRRVRHEDDESLPLSSFGDSLRSINYETRTPLFLSFPPSLSLSLSLSHTLSPPTRVRSRCDSPVTSARARRRAAPRRAGTSVQRRKRDCSAAVAAVAAAARASTITIIYADGASTLTFNVPPPPRGEWSDRSLRSQAARATARGEIMALLGVINSRWRSEPASIASVRARSWGAQAILITVSCNKILVYKEWKKLRDDKWTQPG